MGEHRDFIVPRGKLADLLRWTLTVLDALVPAYAVGGQEGLRDAGRT